MEDEDEDDDDTNDGVRGAGGGGGALGLGDDEAEPPLISQACAAKKRDIHGIISSIRRSCVQWKHKIFSVRAKFSHHSPAPSPIKS